MLAFGLSAMAVESGDTVLRKQVPLRDGWLVRQLDTDKADVTALAREAISPDKSWMPARMPAQVHELLPITGAVFEDNFFDLVPGQKRRLVVVNAAGGTRLDVHALNAGPLTIPWKP